MNLRKIRTTKRCLAVIFILLAILLCVGCISPQEDTPPPSSPQPTLSEDDDKIPITVAVTIPPLRQFVEAVGGDRVSVMVMVPPGASPHTYEPTPGQLRALSETDVYVMVGSGIEFENVWMERIMSMNSDMEVIDTSTGIEPLSEDSTGDGGTDPHIWTSPANAVRMVRTIEDGLSRHYPAYADEFSHGADDYVARLEQLDAQIRASREGNPTRPLMVYHPAWGYFAHEYDIPLIVIETDGKEPSPTHLQTMIDRATEEQVTAIVVAPEQTTKNAEVIARETGAGIIYISSLEEDYLAMMHRIADVANTP
ncbi:hypothetical protein AZH53_06480 [Methanomicrobiaceae archaeon CYW5]|uniref:metal ABC transporter solute-binding protein, Zn/Mn family n=1 Tax=Methanovulcanius yangii TaxID=1789227 RepID=UPI0029CA6DCB|nr:zinc ABC transporter substrate-binding protein [Methanovulcanius yangii]MBT8508050.1 hypothetical protein [Methanovulcanius yangii]